MKKLLSALGGLALLAPGAAAAAELPREMLGTWCQVSSRETPAEIVTTVYEKRRICPDDGAPEEWIKIGRRSLSSFEVNCRISNIARNGDRYRVTTICHHAEERPAPWVGTFFLVRGTSGLLTWSSLVIQEPLNPKQAVER
jgi:hypothetical protein